MARPRRRRPSVAPVAEVATGGGVGRYWLAWRRDGTPTGIVIGRFPTAEEAKAAVDGADPAAFES